MKFTYLFFIIMLFSFSVKAQYPHAKILAEVLSGDVKIGGITYAQKAKFNSSNQLLEVSRFENDLEVTQNIFLNNMALDLCNTSQNEKGEKYILLITKTINGATKKFGKTSYDTDNILVPIPEKYKYDPLLLLSN